MYQCIHEYQCKRVKRSPTNLRFMVIGFIVSKFELHSVAIPFERKTFYGFSIGNGIVHKYSLPGSKRERKGRTNPATGE